MVDALVVDRGQPVELPAKELWARLAEEMTTARQLTDCTLSELAERISWSRSHLSNLEHGRGKPTRELVARYDQLFSPKDDEGRLQHLYDAAAAVEQQEKRATYRAERAIVSPEPQPSTPQRGPLRLQAPWIIAAAILLLPVTILLFKLTRPDPPPNPKPRCPPPTEKPEGTFPNPLHTCPGADPSVWRSRARTWYAYTTDRGLSNGAMDIFRSTDDRHTWARLGSIFPPDQLPRWVLNQPKTINQKQFHPSYWAPYVHYFHGRYILYYTARDKDLGWNEIGAATATSPEGPWNDIGRPVVEGNGYSVVDPRWFRDSRNAKAYLLWKDDPAPSTGTPRQIVIEEVSEDGLTLVGSPRHILPVSQGWEGNSVGAPSMEYHDGYYYLFYSGNFYGLRRDGTSSYAVGVARATSPTGDFSKYPGNPILVGNKQFEGPGGEDVIQDAGGEWLMFYHAYPKFIDANPSDPDIDLARYLMMDVVYWDRPDGWPRIHNGTPSN